MDREALELLVERPAELGRLCGFTRLRDDLHGPWIREMLLGAEDMTLLAHRGSFKTTCLSLAIAVLMVIEPKKNIIFLRKTEADVAEVLRQVRGILQGPVMAELTERLWGKPARILRATQGEMGCDCFLSPRGAVQLLGCGIGGSLTGKHADLIFTDDIVNLSDRISAAEREYTRSVYMELQNIRNPGGRIINTGTPWHPEDAIALMPGPRRFDCYRTGLLSGAELDGLRRQMSPSLFAANYELRHIADANALFPAAPPFTEDAACLYDGFAHIDAAYGGEDFTALTCARAADRLYLYGRLFRGHVEDSLPAILAECARLRCAPVYLELNGDRGYLARALRSRGCLVRTYSERENKAVKIAAHLHAAWPRVTLLRGTDPDWLNQILAWAPGAAHDDAPDSAACCARIAAAQARRTGT